MQAAILIFLLCCQSAFAQNIGIGTNNPHSSAALDVSSTSKGVLVPRLTTAQRTAVANPATGLLVFDTNTESFWFKTAASWMELVDTSNSAVKKNGTDAYLGTTGNFGIGTATPGYDLHISRRSPSIGFYDSTNSHFSGAIRGDSTNLEISAYKRSAFGNNEPGNLLLQVNTTRSPLQVAGKVGIGTSSPEVKLHVAGGTDLNNTSGGYFQLGNSSGANVVFDNDEMQARNNGAAAKLHLQLNGGGLQVGSGEGAINLTSSGEVNRNSLTGTANLLPLAFGRISTSGNIQGSTGNFTVQKGSTGLYKISLPGESNLYQNRNNYVILVTPYNTNAITFNPLMVNAAIAADNTIEVRMVKPFIYWTNSSCSEDCGPFSYIQNFKFYDEVDNEFSVLIYKY